MPSRDDLKCPDCMSTGLEARTRRARQFDTKEEQIIYASKCPNCGNRVNPSEIRKQLDLNGSKSSGGRPSLSLSAAAGFVREASIRTFTTAIGVVLLIIALSMFGLNLPGGAVLQSGGTAEAAPAPYNNTQLSDQAGDPTIIDAEGNWTIYGYNGSYTVSGPLNGSTVYLDDSGSVVDDPHFFGTLEAARQAVVAWFSQYEQDPNSTAEPTNQSLIGTPGLQIFELDGGHVVAGEVDGEVQYLAPTLSLVDQPVFYANYSQAQRYLLAWNSQMDHVDVQEVTVDELTTDLASMEVVNLHIFELESSDYVVAGEINDTVHYLYPDLSLSESPHYYGDYQTAYDTLIEWRGSETDVSVEPITLSRIETDLQSTDSDTSTSVSGGTATSSSSSTSLSGTFTDADGNPVEGATVELHSNVRTTTTDANGNWAFQDVSSGNHTLAVIPPDGSSLAATEEIDLSVQDDGDVYVEGSPSHVSFYPNEDGSIAGNELTVMSRPSQTINATGEGTNVSTSIEFANFANADDVEISLLPKYTATQKSTTISGKDTTAVLRLNGSTTPENQSIFLTGLVANKKIEITDVYAGDSKHEIPIKGNIQSADPILTIYGNTLSEAIKTESNDNNSYSVNGYLSDFTSNLTPVYTATEASTSVSGHSTSQTLHIDGKVKPKTQYINLNGEIVTASQTASGSLSGPDSDSVGLNGNMNTQSTTVDITPKNTQATLVSGYDDLYVHCEDYSYNSNSDSDTVLTIPSDGTYDMSFTASFYANAGWSERVYLDWNLKAKYPDGSTTTLRSYHESVGTYGSSPPDQTHSYKGTFPAGTKIIQYGEVSLNSGGDGTVNVYEGYVKTSDPVKNTVISHDGTTIQSFSSLTEGQSKTVDLGSVSPDSPIDISVDEGEIDYTVNYEARAIPEQATISTGSQTYTWNDDFAGSNTLPQPTDTPSQIDISSLSIGANSISLSTGEIDGIQTEATAEFVYDDQTDQTRDPKITVIQPDGTNHSETIENGVLNSSSNISVSENWFDSDGENTIEIESNGPSPDTEIKYTPLDSPSNLSASINGNEVWTHTDRFSENDRIKINLSQSYFENDSITFEINSRDNSTDLLSNGDAQLNYTLNYTAQATPTAATIQIGTNAYDYPEDFQRTGKLPYPPTDKSAKLNISSLTTGEQPISINTDPVDGIETKAKATIIYDGDTKQTYQPAVIVEAPDGTRHTKPIPDSALENGTLTSKYSMQLPQEWFGEGENRVWVRTSDGSIVETHLQATGWTSQYPAFKESYVAG